MKNSEQEFLKSAHGGDSKIGDINAILEWVRAQNDRVEVEVERIAFKDMTHWGFDALSGSLRHDSGRFFSIDGIQVSTNWGTISSWNQPIINQPEIGYLGFIVKRINGVLHFLVQAKIEPGNVNHVQISPTIQATRSNYTQVHKGRKPLYLEYFRNVKSDNVLLDQLQSEQGARFLMKRNRNIIINVDEDIPVYDNFEWLTLQQIKTLMRFDNLVNMDTRTVISGIQFSDPSVTCTDALRYLADSTETAKFEYESLKSVVTTEGAVHSINGIIHFLTDIKSRYDLIVDRIPLNDVKQWAVLPDEISRGDGKYFKVIGVNVAISNREIMSWQQPMIQPSQPGICAFVCKKINGILHLIVQAKLECGNRDIVELAPTVQCLTGDYRQPDSQPVPFLDYILGVSREQVVVDCLQSEEGGRFYREQNRNILVIADESFPDKLPDHYIWMTLNQLFYFNRFNNYLNIQARNLLAAIAFS